MSKLGRHRNSGTDLDSLLRTSSHTTSIRVAVHTLLCVAALILGFSISREAVLIVVSFRLPNGSLLVKTTSSPDGHEVAIISFPHMQHRHAFTEVHHPKQTETRFAHRKAPSLPTFVGGTNIRAQSEQVSSTEPKNAAHHMPTHAPAFQLLSQETMATSTKASRSSRVQVGRHEILIRAWPHPDPSQTLAAYHLIRTVQEEQRHHHRPQERKPLLIITPTYTDTFQAAHLTSLIHTLRLVPSPLLWIVVEASNRTNNTAAMLSSSMLPFRHLSLRGAMPASTHLMASLRTEGLRYIYEHRLEGVVVFADDTITYTLHYFDEVQRVNLFGSFMVGATNCSNNEGHACVDMPNGISLLMREANQSASRPSLHEPCGSSTRIVHMYPLMRNEATQGSNSSIGALHWSDFVFNARLLWQNPKVSWNEALKARNTFVQQPMDLINNVTQVESLGKCGYF